MIVLTIHDEMREVEMRPLTNAEVRTALQGSIKKWEEIVNGTGADLGCSNCPLCQMFLVGSLSCDGCPIAEYTNSHHCLNSPYGDWDTVRFIYGDDVCRTEFIEEKVAAAQRMLKFLQNLDRTYFEFGVTVNAAGVVKWKAWPVGEL